MTFANFQFPVMKNRFGMDSLATAKCLTLVNELANVTTHFDLPSSPHFVTDFL